MKTWWGGTKIVRIGYRTSIKLWDDAIFSYKRSDFADAGINLPADYLGDLSPLYETYAQTIGSLNFLNSSKFKIVFISSCYSAQLKDMARALGMYSTNSENNFNQVYLGWKDPAPMSETYNRYEVYFWNAPYSLGGPHSVFEALNYAAGGGGVDIPANNITAWGCAQENTTPPFGSRWGSGLKTIYFAP